MVNEVILLEIAILPRNEDPIIRMIDMILEAILKKDLKMEVGENELLLTEDEEDQVRPLMNMKDEGDEDDHIVLLQNQIENPRDKDEDEHLPELHQTTEDEGIIQVKKTHRKDEKKNEKTQRQIQSQTEE